MAEEHEPDVPQEGLAEDDQNNEVEEQIEEQDEKNEDLGPVEEEEHDDYQKDEEDDEDGEERSASFEPYDPKNLIEIDVKTSAKIKGLKKYILDKIDMFKKVNILLYKKNDS